jgi:hypothetical protein
VTSKFVLLTEVEAARMTRMHGDAIEMSLAMERRVRTDDRRAPRPSPDPDFAAYHASPRIRATLDTRSHTQRSFPLTSLLRVRRHDVF